MNALQLQFYESVLTWYVTSDHLLVIKLLYLYRQKAWILRLAAAVYIPLHLLKYLSGLHGQIMATLNVKRALKYTSRINILPS